MRIVDYDMSFGEIHILQPEEYEDVPITDLSFSVRVMNRFVQNDIKTVAALLKTTPNKLMKLRGFGANCLDEVNAICAKLCSNSITDNRYEDNHIPVMSLTFRENRDALAVGDFSVFDNMTLSNSDAEILHRYKEAYNILGDELVLSCINAAEKIVPIREMLVNYQNSVKKQIEILNISTQILLFIILTIFL